jgi:hypothetical protein
MFVGWLLPGHHLSNDSKDSVKQGLALIATLSALVLGLLVATTKGTYDTQNAAVKDLASNVMLLDRILDLYGSESKDARETLRNVVRVAYEKIWPDDGGTPNDVASDEIRVAGDALFDRLSGLQPKTDAQRLFKSRALEIVLSMAQTRQRLLAQKESSIPRPFLVVLGFWLTILFACYGVMAPRNLTVVLTLVVCMISVAGAIFLILEMDKPFDGIMRISGAPLRTALSRIGG